MEFEKYREYMKESLEDLKRELLWSVEIKASPHAEEDEKDVVSSIWTNLIDVRRWYWDLQSSLDT